jgi:hypothetical protein
VRAVLTGIALDPTGAVLAHGRSRRLASPAQLRALIARDRGCIVPGCGLPPSRCQAHHVLWWRLSGRTDITNLVLLCPRHHTAVHTGHWLIQMIDGTPWLLPPRGPTPPAPPAATRSRQPNTTPAPSATTGRHPTSTSPTNPAPTQSATTHTATNPPARPSGT